MTEYTESKQDREDAKQIAALDEAQADLVAAREALGDGTAWTRRTREGMLADLEAIGSRRARLVREGEARISEFHSDRSRVKRAAATLRKDYGFVVSFAEPQDRPSPKIEAAEGPYACTRRTQFDYAFEIKDPRGYYRTRETGLDLTGDLYMSWGPIDGDSEDTFAIGSTIAYAFAAEGLDVEWDGSGAWSVVVKPKAAAETEAVR